MKENAALDPVLVPTIERRLTSITEELGIRTVKSCYSYPTGYLRDLGTQIFDNQERLVAQAEWLPAHCGGSNIALQGLLDYIGRDNIYPDDFIIGNHPYIVRSGHLADWSFVRPVFYEGELVFYLYMRTHQYDSGGSNQGAYQPKCFDIFGEGVIIPPVKIIERGKIDEKVYQQILANVRGSAMVRADNLLINSSMIKAEERILDMCRAYGIDTVRQAIDILISSTEEWVRSTIRKWPGGVYRSQGIIDSDGTTPDTIVVNLTLTIDSDAGQLIFDYRDNMKQVDFINGSLGALYSYTLLPLRWSLPAGLSRNQGLYNCITILTERGTICDCDYPATCGGQGPVFGSAIANCIQLALAQAIPKDVPAGWPPHFTPIFSGKDRFKIDPRTGGPRLYWSSPFTSEASSGAIWGYDAWNSLGHCTGSGAMTRAPIEVQEQENPWRFLRCEWLTDSSGHGQWRGGIGCYAEYEYIASAENYRPGDCLVITGCCNGEKAPQFGLLGGTQSINNEMWIKRKGELMPLHTMELVDFEPGDILIITTGGGGGVGDPLDREVDKVRWDVLNEYVSMETARDTYGVIMNPGTFEVDLETTKELRARKKQA